jgi:hypothetical protein
MPVRLNSDRPIDCKLLIIFYLRNGNPFFSGSTPAEMPSGWRRMMGYTEFLSISVCSLPLRRKARRSKGFRLAPPPFRRAAGPVGAGADDPLSKSSSLALLDLGSGTCTGQTNCRPKAAPGPGRRLRAAGGGETAIGAGRAKRLRVIGNANWPRLREKSDVLGGLGRRKIVRRSYEPFSEIKPRRCSDFAKRQRRCSRPSRNREGPSPESALGD